MKKVKEFFRDVLDNNPATVALVVFAGICFACYCLHYSIVGEIVDRWADSIRTHFAISGNK